MDSLLSADNHISFPLKELMIWSIVINEPNLTELFLIRCQSGLQGNDFQTVNLLQHWRLVSVKTIDRKIDKMGKSIAVSTENFLLVS